MVITGLGLRRERVRVTDSSAPASVSRVQFSLDYVMPGLGREPFSLRETPKTKLNQGPERMFQLQTPLTSHAHTASHGVF